jgi:transposase
MDDRHRDVALFRYSLIREAADPALTKAERGRLVRALAARDHTGPGGERVRVSRNTLDRWIRNWRAGGYEALVPTSRSAEQTTPVAMLDLAVKLKHEAPRRTAAQVAEVISAAEGWGPSARTIQRLFARLGMNTRPDGTPPEAFGRFEAAEPNDRWTGDALHGPTVGGHKAYLFAFIAGATPKTPCAWRQRCATPLGPGASPARPTSTTAALLLPPRCCGRVRCWGSAWSTPGRGGPKAGARSRDSSAPCATSTWSKSSIEVSPTWSR